MNHCVLLEDGTKQTIKTRNTGDFTTCILDLYHLYGAEFMVYKVNGHVNRTLSSFFTYSCTHTLKAQRYYINTYSMCSNPAGAYCTSCPLNVISCKMRVCILGKAINFQAAPIILITHFRAVMVRAAAH